MRSCRSKRADLYPRAKKPQLLIKDSTPPELIVTSKQAEFTNKAFEFAAKVNDLTDVSYTWSLLSSPEGGALDLPANEAKSSWAIDAKGDGLYKLSLLLVDRADNESSYDFSFTLDETPPSFDGLVLAGDAADGLIGKSELLNTSDLALKAVVSDASGIASNSYALILDGVTCGTGVSFSESMPKSNSSVFSVEGDYRICARIEDNAGNVSYGESEVITYDADAPVITSFDPANEALDGYINVAEKDSSSPIAVLTQPAERSDSILYTAAISSGASVIGCDETQSYTEGSVPLISDLSADGAYTLCAKVSNARGTSIYAKLSSLIIKDTVPPSLTMTSVSWVNDSNKSSYDIEGACGDNTGAR